MIHIFRNDLPVPDRVYKAEMFASSSPLAGRLPRQVGQHFSAHQLIHFHFKTPKLRILLSY